MEDAKEGEFYYSEMLQVNEENGSTCVFKAQRRCTESKYWKAYQKEYWEEHFVTTETSINCISPESNVVHAVILQ
jgi:hypothetical protein